MTYPPPGIRYFLILLVVSAAITDIRSRRIPNWLTGPAAILAIGLNYFLYRWQGLRESLIGLAVALGVYLALYLLRAMGAGDVKLMAAVGAAAGPTNWQNWLGIFVLTSIAGGILAIITILARGIAKQTGHNLFLMIMSFRRGRAPYQDHPNLDVGSEQAVRLPHAVAIAFGTLGFIAAGYFFAPH